MQVQEKLKTIWDHFGSRKQILKTIEELNEFSASLSRFLNDDKGYFGVYDEFADVEIMLEQLKFLFDVEVINEKKNKKIERTLERIENCYYMEREAISERTKSALAERISERTKSALAERKRKGVKLGRPKGSKLEQRKAEIKKYQDLGLNKTSIAKLLGVARVTYINFLNSGGKNEAKKVKNKN